MTLVTGNTLYPNNLNPNSLPNTQSKHQREINNNVFSSLVSRHADSGTAMSKHISFGIEPSTSHMNSDGFVID
jgi:hypothetical protein